MATKKTASSAGKSAKPAAGSGGKSAKSKSDPFTPEDLKAIAEALTARLGVTKAKLVMKILHDAGATPPPPGKPSGA